MTGKRCSGKLGTNIDPFIGPLGRNYLWEIIVATYNRCVRYMDTKGTAVLGGKRNPNNKKHHNKPPQNQASQQAKKPMQNKTLVSLEKLLPFSNSRYNISISECWVDDIWYQFNHY